VAYVAEVIIDGARPAQWVDLVFSIAGRESVFTRRWVLSHGRLDAPAAADMAGVVASTLTESIVTMCGLQEVLPLS